jgi:hypothetical protein
LEGMKYDWEKKTEVPQDSFLNLTSDWLVLVGSVLEIVSVPLLVFRAAAASFRSSLLSVCFYLVLCWKDQPVWLVSLGLVLLFFV